MAKSSEIWESVKANIAHSLPEIGFIRQILAGSIRWSIIYTLKRQILFLFTFSYTYFIFLFTGNSTLSFVINKKSYI